MTKRPTFEGITPYLHYEDAAAMLDWYARVFGFKEKARWPDANGVIHNAEMIVGSTELWLDGSGPNYWEKKGSRADQTIGVWVDDVDAMHARIVAAGVDAPSAEDKPYVCARSW